MLRWVNVSFGSKYFWWVCLSDDRSSQVWDCFFSGVVLKLTERHQGTPIQANTQSILLATIVVLLSKLILFGSWSTWPGKLSKRSPLSGWLRSGLFCSVLVLRSTCKNKTTTDNSKKFLIVLTIALHSRESIQLWFKERISEPLYTDQLFFITSNYAKSGRS